MTELLIIISSIVFFFIGRWSKKFKLPKKEETIDEIVEKARTSRIKAGVIPFKKPEEFTKEAIEDKKLDDEWIRSGKDKLIK